MLRAPWRSILASLPALAALGCSAADAGADADGDDAGAADSAPGGATSDGARTSDAVALDGSCPDEMSLVRRDGGTVCIDHYEGAIVLRAEDGGEAPWPYYLPLDGLDAPDAGRFRAVPARGIAPQGYISEVQSEAACRASGKRLCTYDEWIAACRGQPAHDNVYPYGDTYEPGACNEGHESPIVRLFGPTPTYSSAELNDPRCDQLDGGLARGGDFPRCVSAYGAFDMHGNLHEWVDDTPVPGEPDRGSFLGGYFVDARVNGAGCEYRTTAHAKTYHDYSTGFRCCADVR